jgi:RNA polymerase sigma-70 factor (ECF subfamily)
MSNPEPQDAVLIERAKRGDRHAFDDLVAKYQTRVYQFAYRLSGDAETASDLTAEAFVRVYTNLHRFRFDSKFTTWVFRIVTNCFLDLRKREQVRKHESLEELLTTADSEMKKQFGSEDESPLEIAERGERGKALEAAIHRLPEYQRAMIVMYHIEMLSYEEIAQTLDMPIGTVKSRLNRARLALKQVLDPMQELFSG